tara:strand:- start:5893 stop:7698 length:1806 start_codon:yes stop_codon:yes gene_type:complete
MAGGKETPRQKMIGMMYLVLTALLALNVSKSILDAFINIEANVAAGNVTEVQRGDEKKSDVASKQTNDEGGENKTAVSIYKVMQNIDKVAAEKIQLIDRVKLLIFQSIGEDLSMSAELPIIIKDRATFKLDYANATKPGLTANSEPCKPLSTNLNHVQKKDAYDEQMLIMGINESIQSPNKKAPGFAVWPAMQQFRKEICDLIVDASSAIDEDGKKYSFNDPKIIKYKDLNDLDKQLSKALDASNIKQDDRGIIANLYKGLTKNEMQPDPHEEGKMRHWVGGTFDHAPAVAAIAALSGLQSEVLTARADAMAYLSSKVGGGNYAFNKVTSLAIAAPSVTGGATDTLRVMMAAFDSEKQPIVTPDEGKGTLVETKGGQAYVAYTAPSGGEIELTGTIAIKDKFGNLKPAQYSTVVKVVEKGGSIALPEVSVFYTDWPNKVTYSASGVVSTSVSCRGCSKTVKNKSWKDADGVSFKGDWLYVNRGTRNVTVTLQGKDNNGNNVKFGDYKYPVKKFPKPEVKTKSISKARGGFLDVGLGDAFNFKGIKYKVTGGEILGKGFSGDRLKPANLSKARQGQKIGIVLFTKRTDTGKKDIIDGVIEIK